MTLRAEVRSADLADHAELSLHIVTLSEEHSQDRPPGPGPSQRMRRNVEQQGETITGSRDWTHYELTIPVPGDAEHMGFDLTLVGSGQAELRNVSLSPAGCGGAGPWCRRPAGCTRRCAARLGRDVNSARVNVIGPASGWRNRSVRRAGPATSCRAHSSANSRLSAGQAADVLVPLGVADVPA